MSKLLTSNTNYSKSYLNLTQNEKKILKCLKNRDCSISTSQLARELRINPKNIGRYVNKLIEQKRIIREDSIYNKREKLLKLNQPPKKFNKMDRWVIKDLIELNGCTFDDLMDTKIASQYDSSDFEIALKKIIKELNLEATIRENEAKKVKKKIILVETLDLKDVKKWNWFIENYPIYVEYLKHELGVEINPKDCYYEILSLSTDKELIIEAFIFEINKILKELSGLELIPIYYNSKIKKIINTNLYKAIKYEYNPIALKGIIAILNNKSYINKQIGDYEYSYLEIKDINFDNIINEYNLENTVLEKYKQKIQNSLNKK